MKRTPLQRKAPLRRTKPMKQGKSDKQKALDLEWQRVTIIKWSKLKGICEWCGEYVLDPVGHHIIRRSRGRVDTPENCKVLHWHCHSVIHDQGVDVAVYKTKKLWEDK